METEEVQPVAVKRPGPTPKTLIHQKFGTNACYRIEEVKQSVDSIGLGLVIPQQTKCLYRCSLDLPELSVTSGLFTRKKEAEQSAAKIAIEKLAIQSPDSNPTLKDAFTELVDRLSYFFSNEFFSSNHPLRHHFGMAMRKAGDFYGMIPLSAIAACDTKVNILCKEIDPKAELNPLLPLSILLKAARMSSSICITDGELWIQKKGSFSPEALELLPHCSSGKTECNHVEAVRVPCLDEDHVEALTLDVSDNMYYMDEIAKNLNLRNSSRVLVSRTIGKASSEMKLFFSAPEGFPLDSSVNAPVTVSGNADMETTLNIRASYFSGQMIYGDAILANVGYRYQCLELFFADTSLCTYYRMLLAKVPDGHYKLSREAILAAELPTAFTARSNWRGPSPRDLLRVFCRQHRQPEPSYDIKIVNSSGTSSGQAENGKKMKLSEVITEVEQTNGGVGNGHLKRSSYFSCEVKILSRRQDPLVECFLDTTCTKESDAIQNTALHVLAWLNNYFKQLDMPIEKLSSLACSHNIKISTQNFAREFALWPSIYGVQPGSVCIDQPNGGQENGLNLFNVEGPDSGVFPSPGSFACISYTVALVRKGESLKEPLESNDEFEFEIGTGSVIKQLETCVAQLSLGQTAQFTIELPSRELILAASGESAKRLSDLSLYNCFLEYSVKVLKVTEPLEDRMEQALFSPPLSKQRVNFAVRHINESRATTLVDFGCGSGSLLSPLLEHTTTLEKIVGVDISRKSLPRAAKILHTKLNMNPAMHSSIRSAVLYLGSILDFDSRLYGFDIGTCLEVIEHMQEEEACMFGDAVLSRFCPRLLIVSTPNYEYNPILQRAALANREDDLEEKSSPCKFRNYDHKFEWTRQQFERWAGDLAARHDYSVEFSGVGGSGDAEPGFASQIAIFRSRMQVAEKKGLGDEETHRYEVIWEWVSSSAM